MSGPVCINYGCNSFCHERKRSPKTGKINFRSVCSHCHLAGMRRHSFKKGVTPFKVGKCTNDKGYLGFVCTAKIIDPCQTELDHIDGNRLNNVPKNVQELCKNCHAVKTKLNGDAKCNKVKVMSLDMIEDLGFPTIYSNVDVSI